MWKKNTFWDAFFISQTDVTLYVSSCEKKENQGLPCLQDHVPYLGQGEECAIV